MGSSSNHLTGALSHIIYEYAKSDSGESLDDLIAKEENFHIKDTITFSKDFKYEYKYCSSPISFGEKNEKYTLTNLLEEMEIKFISEDKISNLEANEVMGEVEFVLVTNSRNNRDDDDDDVVTPATTTTVLELLEIDDEPIPLASKSVNEPETTPEFTKEEDPTEPMLITLDDEAIPLAQAPKTGDTADMVKWIFLLIASFGTGVVVLKKEKSQKKTEDNQ